MFFAKYGRTIVAMIILILNAALGDVDLTNLETFLTSVLDTGAVTVGATAALVAHYFGERQIELFESKQEAKKRKRLA
jgi:hypothetical protein